MSRTQMYDLRAAARAFLSGGRAEPLALDESALQRIRAIARSETPLLAEHEPQALAALGGSSTNVRGGVAVVPLQGIITPRGSFLSLLFGGGPGGLQGFRRDFNEALGSSDVDAIVLDIHSPGGLIGLVPETAAEIRAARGDKPIVAVANTMMGSAAYWIGAQADELVITPSGMAGSIGVYVVHEDWSGFNEQAGIDPTYIYAGRYKVEGNPDEPLSDEARNALQQEVLDLYGLFVDDVAAGRGVSAQDVRDGMGEGRILPAARAVAEDLGDRVATIEDTIRDRAGGARAGGRRKRASDPTPTIRAQGDTPEPNETSTADEPEPAAEVPEEVRARIAELQSFPPPTTL